MRVRYQLFSRLWIAAGSEYGSGLPFEFAGSSQPDIAYQEALAEYGQAVVNRVNFSGHRVRPNCSFDLSVGADLYKKETHSLRLQADAENLNNRLNVIDFGGLFSGNAIAPPRSYFLRLAATY